MGIGPIVPSRASEGRLKQEDIQLIELNEACRPGLAVIKTGPQSG
jgi:hypothetical protein